MHVRAKSIAFGGLLLALSVVCMALGSVIETNPILWESLYGSLACGQGQPFIWRMCFWAF